MSWRRPGMSLSSILIWIRTTDMTGKLRLWMFILLLIVPMICTGCKRSDKDSPELVGKNDTEYGDFKIDNRLTENASQELIRIMKIYEDIYKGADKGESANIVLEDNVIQDIQEKLAESGLTVYTSVPYRNIITGLEHMSNKCYISGGKHIPEIDPI